MAQQVKKPPAVKETQETRVQPLGREDPLGEGMATHLLGKSYGQRSPAGYSLGAAEWDTTE